MKSSYDIGVVIWRKDRILFKGDEYELKEEIYFVENPTESDDDLNSALPRVGQKDIYNKRVPVLRKVPL